MHRFLFLVLLLTPGLTLAQDADGDQFPASLECDDADEDKCQNPMSTHNIF